MSGWSLDWYAQALSTKEALETDKRFYRVRNALVSGPRIGTKPMVQAVDLLDEDEYKSLSPDEKEKYVFETLEDLLHKHPEGVTRSDIQEVTPFGRKTIDKHLEKLVALNEGYIRRRGGTDVYYPNGKLLHDGVNDRKTIDGKTFEVKHLENVSGELIYIQELEEDKYGSEQVKGGLLIPQELFSEFVEWLESAAEKMEDGYAGD